MPQAKGLPNSTLGFVMLWLMAHRGSQNRCLWKSCGVLPRALPSPVSLRPQPDSGVSLRDLHQ